MSAPLVTEPANDTWPWGPWRRGRSDGPSRGRSCLLGRDWRGRSLRPGPGPRANLGGKCPLGFPCQPPSGAGKPRVIMHPLPVSLGSSR